MRSRVAARLLSGLILAACVTASTLAADIVKLRPVAALYSDGKGSALRKPEGVACDGKGGLVVADTGNARLVRFTLAAETAASAGEIVTAGGGEIVLGQLPYPIRVQVSSGGEIFALDGKLRKIARLSPSGEFKGYVDLLAAGVQSTAIPRSFKLAPDGTLYVLDIYGARVLVLGTDGKLLRQIAFPEKRVFFSDLAVGADGTVFLLDSVGKRVYTAARDSAAATPLPDSLKEDLGFPTAMTADERGRLFVVDENGGGIVILGQDGSYRGRQSGLGWKEGFLRYPGQLCLDGKGTLFVADRENNRIQVFMTGR